MNCRCYIWMTFVLSFIHKFTERRKEFERRRKLHYNEFEAVLRARELMEQDEEDDGNEQIEVDEPSPSAK